MQTVKRLPALVQELADAREWLTAAEERLGRTVGEDLYAQEELREAKIAVREAIRAVEERRAYLMRMAYRLRKWDKRLPVPDVDRRRVAPCGCCDGPKEDRCICVAHWRRSVHGPLVNTKCSVHRASMEQYEREVRDIARVKRQR